MKNIGERVESFFKPSAVRAAVAVTLGAGAMAVSPEAEASPYKAPTVETASDNTPDVSFGSIGAMQGPPVSIPSVVSIPSKTEAPKVGVVKLGNPTIEFEDEDEIILLDDDLEDLTDEIVLLDDEDGEEGEETSGETGDVFANVDVDTLFDDAGATPSVPTESVVVPEPARITSGEELAEDYGNFLGGLALTGLGLASAAALRRRREEEKDEDLNQGKNVWGDFDLEVDEIQKEDERNLRILASGNSPVITDTVPVARGWTLFDCDGLEEVRPESEMYFLRVADEMTKEILDNVTIKELQRELTDLREANDMLLNSIVKQNPEALFEILASCPNRGSMEDSKGKTEASLKREIAFETRRGEMLEGIAEKMILDNRGAAKVTDIPGGNVTPVTRLTPEPNEALLSQEEMMDIMRESLFGTFDPSDQASAAE